MDNDMVMINSLDMGKGEDENVCVSSDHSDDGSIAVVYKTGDSPTYFADNNFPSISSVCSQDGSPLEQREDIFETKRIPERLKSTLNFNDEVKLREVEEQMKARENIDQDMENEIQNMQTMAANKLLEDQMLRDALQTTCEKAKEVRQVAKNGKTTLKRAMEIMEVALPPFLIACEKSYEKNDLTLQVGIEYEQYETCMSEKRKAGLDFDLGERKTVEASNHLNECIRLSKEDENRMREKQQSEVEEGRGKIFKDAKGEMDDIINSEIDEVNNCLLSCKSDLENIDIIKEEQEKRFHLASVQHEKSEKTLDTKINVNQKNQEDLRKQLERLEKQERLLLERRKYEQQVQERAKELNTKVSEQLIELRKSIENVQSCAKTSLTVMELMQDGGNKLLCCAIKAEEQYLSHLNDLDVEAKTNWRNALATSAVEKRLAIKFATMNIEEGKEKCKEMKGELRKAVQRQSKLNAERLKKEMEECKDEIKKEDKKKKQATDELNGLLEQVAICDEKLLQLGRKVESIDLMYEHRVRELEDSNTDDLSSIEFSQDEDSDDNS